MLHLSVISRWESKADGPKLKVYPKGNAKGREGFYFLSTSWDLVPLLKVQNVFEEHEF